MAASQHQPDRPVVSLTCWPLATGYGKCVVESGRGVKSREGQGGIETKFSVAPRIESAMAIPYRGGTWGGNCPRCEDVEPVSSRGREFPRADV